MRLSANGFNILSAFEGVKLTAYQDSIGIWTIGIGFIRVGGKPVVKGQKMTMEDVHREFSVQIATYENIINRNVTKPLNQNQYDALVSFVFNLGEPNFKSSTLLKKINANPNDPSIAAEFLKWNKAGNKVIPGLTKRRDAEAKLYFTK